MGISPIEAGNEDHRIRRFKGWKAYQKSVERNEQKESLRKTSGELRTKEGISKTVNIRLVSPELYNQFLHNAWKGK